MLFAGKLDWLDWLVGKIETGNNGFLPFYFGAFRLKFSHQSNDNIIRGSIIPELIINQQWIAATACDLLGAHP